MEANANNTGTRYFRNVRDESMVRKPGEAAYVEAWNGTEWVPDEAPEWDAWVEADPAWVEQQLNPPQPVAATTHNEPARRGLTSPDTGGTHGAAAAGKPDR